MEIEVKLLRIYGKERFYPYNEIARTICGAFDKLTLTKEQLITFKSAGWKVVIITEEYKLD